MKRRHAAHSGTGDASPASVDLVPGARRSRRKAMKQYKKMMQGSGALEVNEIIVKPNIPMWRSYYSSPVSRRRKRKYFSK